MTRTGVRGRAWPAPLLAATGLVGPALAAAHETDVLSIGPPATLWPIAVIAVGAAFGVLTGIRLVRRGRWLAGALVALPNVAVAALYGFLLVFFGLGGSR